MRFQTESQRKHRPGKLDCLRFRPIPRVHVETRAHHFGKSHTVFDPSPRKGGLALLRIEDDMISTNTTNRSL